MPPPLRLRGRCYVRGKIGPVVVANKNPRTGVVPFAGLPKHGRSRKTEGIACPVAGNLAIMRLEGSRCNGHQSRDFPTKSCRLSPTRHGRSIRKIVARFLK